MLTHRLLKLVSVSVLLTLVFAPLGSAPAWAGSTVANAGFEADNDVTTAPMGWTVAGTPGTGFTEWGGHSGNWRLSHWSAEPYVVETSQTLTGLARGWYTLRVWVKSSGGQNQAYIALKRCGGREARTYLPVAPPSQWVQIVVSAY